MISIDRLEEMAIEELETKLNNWKEQVELQSNFIDSLLKATNNSEWLNKTILDDEASEIIEKIELDYVQLDQLKAENKSLKDKLIELLGKKGLRQSEKEKYIQTLTEIKEIAEKQCNVCKALTPIDEYKDCKKCWQGVILQKISECEGNDEN